MASQKQLEGTRVTRKGDSNIEILAPTFTMVAAREQCHYRPTITPNKTCSAIFTDASKEGWGACINERTARGTWSLPGSKLHIYYLELKAVFPVLKRVPRPLHTQNSNCRDRQHHSGVIHKQGRRHEVGPTWGSTVENLDLVHQKSSDSQSPTHSRLAECGSRQASYLG